MMSGPNSSGRSDGQDHDGPTGLAIADHARLAVGVRMQRDDFFDENRFGARDVLDRLSGHRFGQKADEVAGMTRFHRDADLAVRLEAANAGSVPRARIDHHERPALEIDFHALGGMMRTSA